VYESCVADSWCWPNADGDRHLSSLVNNFRATTNYFNRGELASNDEAERSAIAEPSALDRQALQTLAH